MRTLFYLFDYTNDPIFVNMFDFYFVVSTFIVNFVPVFTFLTAVLTFRSYQKASAFGYHQNDQTKAFSQ